MMDASWKIATARTRQAQYWNTWEPRGRSRRSRQGLVSKDREEGVNCEYLKQMLAKLESLSE